MRRLLGEERAAGEGLTASAWVGVWGLLMVVEAEGRAARTRLILRTVGKAGGRVVMRRSEVAAEAEERFRMVCGMRVVVLEASCRLSEVAALTWVCLALKLLMRGRSVGGCS